jgi:alkanesulfonate monooxygenase SsuD/methylene tetrahydromethanopterin reductase-like flavin-dependent oxidoreductase (luciferase family)
LASNEELAMEFGYFTLSDNHYENNARSSNQFVGDITAEALYADKLGMSSAWIGEHHFNSLGVLSCPDIVLAYVAANTTRIRLAPAVTVLPLHNPIRVAEQWATLDLLSGGRVVFAAGRGYDRREYLPFHVSFEDNQGIFEEGLELVRQLWAAEGRISHHGITNSMMCASHRSRCNVQSQHMSARSRNPQSSSPRDWAVASWWRRLQRR